MTEESINDRIDQDKNNSIDINEINDFIFNQNEWDKNLNDLGEYLNKLPTYFILNNDQIKNSIKNWLNNYQERKEIKKDIVNKINKNAPLTKKELSLVYLDMLSDDNFRKFLPISNRELKFDASKPIDQICNWKLVQFIRHTYLNLMYTGNNWWENIKPASETQSNIKPRPATEEEISWIPQSIKALWNLFVKWKDYLVKKASWIFEPVWEFIGGIFRTFIDFSKIISSPLERNTKTGITLCSKTAQKNAHFFWLSIPGWNAKEWVESAIIDKEHFVSTKTKSWNNNIYLDINTVSPDTANFADISVTSNTPNWKKYWHRSTAFKNSDGKRYVLDPYYSWWHGNKPIPWENYPKHSVAEQINFYNAPKQSKIT